MKHSLVSIASAGVLGVVLAACGAPDRSDNRERVLIAVASNFVEALTRLKPAFEASGPFRLEMASGSTGKLYAQIVAGAPYDLFLAADEERPQRLVRDGLALDTFSYARGALVLWSAGEAQLDYLAAADSSRGALVTLLEHPDVRKVAIANPALAPYGRAAEEVLTKLGLETKLRPRLVYGENIGQVHAMVATGNADYGFTAASLVRSAEADIVQMLPISQQLHAPIVQQGALLQRAEGNSAAAAFLQFMNTEAARQIIRTAGYEVAL